MCVCKICLKEITTDLIEKHSFLCLDHVKLLKEINEIKKKI